MAAVFDPFEIRSDPPYDIFQEGSSSSVDPPGGADPGARQLKHTPSRPLIIISGPNSPPSVDDDDARFESNTDDFDIGAEMIHSSAGILESNSKVIESLASRLDADLSFEPSSHHGDGKKHHPHHHHHHLNPVGVLRHPGYDALDENQLPESKVLDLSQVFGSFLHKKKSKSGHLPKKMKKVLGR